MCQKSKQFFLIFHFFHWLKLDLVNGAHCAYGSKLLAHTAHAVAKFCKIVFFASVMLRMRQHFASAHCAYGSKFLAHASHTVSIYKHMLRIWQQFASVHCAYGNKSSNILCFASLYAAHAVANCQCMLRMRQPIASVCCACGSNLLAQTAHAVAKTKWPVSHPSVKNVKFLFHP